MRTLDQYQITLEGEKLSHFSYASISQHHDTHHYFDVGVPITALKNFESKLGKIIKVRIKEKMKHGQVENVFSGMLVEVGTRKHSKESTEVILRGRSPTFLLDGEVHCRSFSEKNLQQIVKEVLKAYPDNLLKAEIKPRSSKTLPYVVQYKESDFQFLSRLAHHFGEWFLYDGNALRFGELPSRDEGLLRLGTNLFQVDLAFKMMPTKFRLLSHDYRKDQNYASTSASASVSGPHSYNKVALKVSDRVMREAIHPYPYECEDKKELDDIVKIRKETTVNSLMHIYGASDSPDLKLGKVFRIEGAEEQDGKFLITSVSHSMDSNGHYVNQFEALPAAVTTPPGMGTEPVPQCETQTAIVQDNDDPEGLGRVRVRFHWQSPPEMSPWIRAASIHSGAERGVYFLPEKGDEVLVGFENNHPDRPFVMGSLYHRNAKPAEWSDPKNNKKAFKTKSGNQIYFDDESGKEEIRISNKNGDNEIVLSLEGSGKIAIKSKDTLELSAKNIALKAESKLTMQTQGEASIEAANASLKASGKLEVNGGGMAEFKAGVIKLN